MSSRVGSWVAAVVLAAACLGPGVAAQTPSDEVLDLKTSIQSKLEKHGDRVIGQNVYHWTTRLESLDQCRAIMTVREETMMGERTVREEQVNISLGRITWVAMDEHKKWINVPCLAWDRCISVRATCTKTTKDGITVDCSSPGIKQDATFRLQWDGSKRPGGRWSATCAAPSSFAALRWLPPAASANLHFCAKSIPRISMIGSGPSFNARLWNSALVKAAPFFA